MPPAAFALALQAAQNDFIEAPGQLRPQRPQRRRIVRDDAGHRRHGIAGVERRLAGEQEIQRRRHRVEVGLGIDLFHFDLLRRGKLRRAQEGAGACQVCLAQQRLCEAKIADLDAAIRFQKAVRRLDVSVDAAELVDFVQPVDHVQDLADRLFRRQWSLFLDETCERGPGHQFHGDVRPPLVLVHRQHEDAARVGQFAGQFALLAEALNRILRRGKFRLQEFQSDAATRRRVHGFEHGAHAPAAQPPEEPAQRPLCRSPLSRAL